MKVPSASRFRNNDDNDGGMFNDDDENMLTVSTTDSLLQLQPKVAVTIQDEVDDEFCKDAFDSLRSEDLYAILAEPFFDSEWDTLMTPID